MKVIGIRFATCTPMTYQEAINKGIEIGGRGIGCKPNEQGYVVDYGYNSNPIWWMKDVINAGFYIIDNMSSDDIANKIKSLVETYKFNDEIGVTKVSDISDKSDA